MLGLQQRCSDTGCDCMATPLSVKGAKCFITSDRVYIRRGKYFSSLSRSLDARARLSIERWAVLDLGRHTASPNNEAEELVTRAAQTRTCGVLAVAVSKL